MKGSDPTRPGSGGGSAARGAAARAAWFLAAAFALAGCSEEESSASKAAPEPTAPASAGAGTAPPPLPQARPRYAVLEQFEVGRNVYVRSLALETAAESLWVGTSSGVHEIGLASREVRQTFTRDHGLANEYVFAIRVDRDGNKWFGTNAGGASRYKDGRWRTFFPMHGLADYWVYSFAEQRTGAFWIGTWEGASRVDPITGEFTNFVDELVNEWVYGIAVDGRDRVWFATEGGVSMLDGAAWRSWTHADGLGAPNAARLAPSKNTGLGTRSRHDLGVLRSGEPTYNPSYVFAIHVAPDDVVWAGTWGGGVARFDGSAWSNFTTADGLAGNIVYSVVEDASGALWFGTDAGVSRFDGTGWTTLGPRDGLIDSHVYALAATPAGEIWAGTRGGVVRIGLKP